MKGNISICHATRTALDFLITKAVPAQDHIHGLFLLCFPGGNIKMFRVRVCAAHMGGFLGPKNSLNKGKQGFFFRQIFLKQCFPEIGKKFQKMSSFPLKFIIKVGMTASFGN